MESMEPKSHPQWWDSHISPENTKWLAENLEGVDNAIKGVFKLIEQDDNSGAETGANYELKKPELIAHIGKFSCMHQLLAERYDHLIGEVRRNAPSLQQMHPLDVYDSGSPIASPMLTPDQKMDVNKSEEAVGFDLFMSSGGGSSNNSIREGYASSVSSSSSSSDSDSESLNSIHKHLVSPLRDDSGYGTLIKKVNDYEEQLLILNKKLQCSEKEVASLKGELKKTESVTVLMSNLQAQLEAAQSKFEIQNTNLEMEKEKVLELQNQVVELETQICDSDSKIKRMGEELEVKRAELILAEDEITKRKKSEGAHELQVQLESAKKDVLFLQTQLDSEQILILKMQEKISRYTADLSDRDNQIRELNAAFFDANEKFSLEKGKLQYDISHVLEQAALLKARVDSLENEIKQYEAENAAMKSFHEANIEMLEAELKQKGESVEDSNKNLDVLKLKNDTLRAEKALVIAQVDMLRAEARSRENLIREMEKQLCQLKTEHTGLISESDTGRKLADELKARVEELEKEVERQSNMISDRAEEKREAIRQLCFSLEHYRVGYKELREAYVGHKRHAVVA